MTSTLPTFVFFHVGRDLSQPSMLVQSICQSNPGARIIQCSDRSSPAVPGVTSRVECEGPINQLMLYRIAAFADLELDSPALYLDTDMLVIHKVDPAGLLGNKRVLMCRRNFDRELPFNGNFGGMDFTEYHLQPLGQVYPFLGCATVTRDSSFYDELLDIYQVLPEKFRAWYGDQEALKIFASEQPADIGFLEEETYACLPEKSDASAAAHILHFKGSTRKALMADMARSFCTIATIRPIK